MIGLMSQERKRRERMAVPFPPSLNAIIQHSPPFAHHERSKASSIEHSLYFFLLSSILEDKE